MTKNAYSGSFGIRASSFLRHSSFGNSSFSEPFFKHPQPVSEQNAFDLVVFESAFDQPPGQGPGLRVTRKLRNEVRVRESLLKRRLLGLRPLAGNELQEIEADGDTVDPNQIPDMFDVID